MLLCTMNGCGMITMPITDEPYAGSGLLGVLLNVINPAVARMNEVHKWPG